MLLIQLQRVLAETLNDRIVFIDRYIRILSSTFSTTTASVATTTTFIEIASPTVSPALLMMETHLYRLDTIVIGLNWELPRKRASEIENLAICTEFDTIVRSRVAIY